MTLDEASRKILQDFVDGKVQGPPMNSTTKHLLWWFLYAAEHIEELDALTEANEGDPTKLAKLVESKGELRVPDARAFVAARLRGEKRTRGLKRTEKNTVRRIRLWHRVTDLMREEGMTQTDALKSCLGGNNEFGDHKGSFETIRSDFKRGGDELREVLESLGFQTNPAWKKQ